MRLEELREARRRRRLRTFLKIMAARGSDPAAAALRDRQLFDDLFDNLRHSVTEDDRPILDLLDWLIEHSDEIIALIEKLMELFSGLSSTVEVE